MPYRSERQRRFMHAAHPDIAARWDAEYGGQIVPTEGNRGGDGRSKKGSAYHRRHKKHRKGK